MHDHPARPFLAILPEFRALGVALGLGSMSAPFLPDIGKVIALVGAVGSCMIGLGSILNARVNARRLSLDAAPRYRIPTPEEAARLRALWEAQHKGK